VHFLLKEFKIFLKSSLSKLSQSLCHTISPREPESESGVLSFLTLESESHKKQGLRIN